MRPRALVVLFAVLALHAAGCCDRCRCCGGSQQSRLPPATDAIKPTSLPTLQGSSPVRPENPAGAIPTVAPQPTAPIGAYGGVGGG